MKPYIAIGFGTNDPLPPITGYPISDHKAELPLAPNAADASELLSILKDVASFLPVAPRMPRQDIEALQLRVVAAIAKAEGRE